MPLYEYRCATCGNQFEILQRIGEDASGVRCPECGDSQVARQLSTFAASTQGSSPSMAATPSGGCCRGSSSCC